MIWCSGHPCCWAPDGQASNLVPTSVSKWSKVRQLSKSSIVFTDKGMIRWSKTTQFRQRILEIPVFAIPNSILCPVKAVRRLLKISKTGPHGLLLALSKNQILTYNMMQRKLKKAIGNLGLNKTKFSTHSLHRGGVVWGERNGISNSMIKVYGNWSSDAFRRYLQFPEEKRLEVAEKMTQWLQNYHNIF